MTAHAGPVSGLTAGPCICAALLSIAVSVSAQATEISARDIAKLLFQTAPGLHPALDGKDLKRLDLSNLDFKKANLSKSDFFGADLSGADLSNTDLSGATLDRVTLVGARLDGANLSNASMMRPSSFSTLNPILREAPSFKAASLKGARFFGTFAGSDFSGADLTDSTCAPTNKSGFIEHIWRTDFTSANLTRATLTHADMNSLPNELRSTQRRRDAERHTAQCGSLRCRFNRR